jgi:hypothetical protein
VCARLYGYPLRFRRRIVTLLYPNFLSDHGEYRQAEALWSEEWAKLLQVTQDEARWETPWVASTFANGTPRRDGSPIFSAVCPSRKLGIRVIQNEPSDDQGELHFWTNIWADGEPEAIKELVISCVLSTETLHASLDIMASWIALEEVHLSSTSTYRGYRDEPLPTSFDWELVPTAPRRGSHDYSIDEAA